MVSAERGDTPGSWEFAEFFDRSYEDCGGNAADDKVANLRSSLGVVLAGSLGRANVPGVNVKCGVSAGNNRGAGTPI